MVVKRRIIWLSDEEWALLQATARERHTTVSQIIQQIWVLAATVPPSDPIAHAAEVEIITARAGAKLGRNPYAEYRPVPKK